MEFLCLNLSFTSFITSTLWLVSGRELKVHLLIHSFLRRIGVDSKAILLLQTECLNRIASASTRRFGFRQNTYQRRDHTSTCRATSFIDSGKPSSSTQSLAAHQYPTTACSSLGHGTCSPVETNLAAG